MDQGQQEYFAIIGEGAALMGSLDEQSSGFFDGLNRLREILAMLGYASAVGPLKFSLADKAGSLEALSGYLNNGINVLPDELALYELMTVSELTQLAGGSTSTLAEVIWERHNALSQKTSSDGAKVAAFNALAGRGIKHGVEQSDLEQMMADAAAHLAKKPEDSAEYVEAREAYQRISRERTQALDALATLIRENSAEGLDVTELLAKRLDLMTRTGDEQTAAWQRYSDLHDEYNRDRVDGHKAIFEARGTAILAKLAEASPITTEQANAWANEQVIDANAKAKLRKLGYKPEDVVRDMAEFYRLTGGKASAIRIGIDGGKRANAVGITERLGEKVINLGSRFTKVTLFHELAHHLENDPIAKAAANGFLLKRREDDSVYRLRDLTGNKGYDASEVAYKDHFMDAYVGKIYPNGITEVWSMGVQYLANPKDAAILAAKDPEMLNLITGYLSMTTPPAMHAKLNMHKSAIGEMQEKRQSEETQYERAVAYLAAQAVLTKDNWFAELDRGSEIYRVLDRRALSKAKKGNPVYVGSHGKFRVFSGTYRNRTTSRNAKGYMIVDGIDDAAWSFNSDDISAEIVHGDIEKVQAVMALAKRDGTGLFLAIWNYFSSSTVRDPKKNLIETVGAENLQ